MKLLTSKLRKQIPPLYSQEANPDPVVQVKLFTPDSSWTWYIIEGSAIVGGKEYPLSESDPRVEDDVVFYGLVYGLDKEFGTFSLTDLVNVRGSLGLPVERDLFFEPKPLSEVEKQHEGGMGG